MSGSLEFAEIKLQIAAYFLSFQEPFETLPHVGSWRFELLLVHLPSFDSLFKHEVNNERSPRHWLRRINVVALKNRVKREGVAQNVEHFSDVVLSRHLHKLYPDGVEQLRVLVNYLDDVVQRVVELTQVDVTSDQVSVVGFSG